MTELREVLANRAWLRRVEPFPHVVAHDVFTREYYAELAAQVEGLLALGLSERPARGRFSRNIPGYDAYGMGLDTSCEGPLSLFLTPAWRDMVGGLFGIGTTPYVFAGLHHHTPGSRDGFIHNDFNPVWFPRADNGAIQVPQQERCSYKTGEGTLPEDQKVEVLRGAAVILFVGNDGWHPGDGGETALFASRAGPVGAPAARCSPESNSLLAFECTPRSFHAFAANRRLPRTSVIMWVHRPLEEGVARFGEEHLERWKR